MYRPAYAAFLWHMVHCIAVGPFEAGLVFFTSVWQPVQLRWNACWLTSEIIAVLDSCLISGTASRWTALAASTVPRPTLRSFAA